jgi:hypothetical protein
LFTSAIYAVYGIGAVVPPPGAGVVTARFTLPGVRLDAGIVAVSCEEFTYVAAMFVPFIATVEFAVNPDPFSVTVVAVLIGPALG